MITQPIVESAELRYQTVEAARALFSVVYRHDGVTFSTDANAEYAPLGLVQMLENIAQAVHNINENLEDRIDQLENRLGNRLDRIAATSHNTRIVARNSRRQAPAPYSPLQKTVCTHLPL